MWRAGGCTKIWKKGGRQYRVVLHKIGGLAPLCQLCEETLKIFHPSIITPPPIPGSPPFLVKISHLPITAIFEKSHHPSPSPLYEERWFGLWWKIVFLKNYTQNPVEKLVLDPFLKNRNWAYTWINSLKCFFFVFLKLRCWLLFEKTNRGLELVSLPQFLLDNWRKVFLTLNFINWPNFIACLPLFLEIFQFVTS